MSEKYTVTVKKTTIETKMVRGRWSKMRETKDGESNFDYAPDREEEVEQSMDIFTQTVDSLDLAALVLVVNGISPHPQSLVGNK